MILKEALLKIALFIIRNFPTVYKWIGYAAKSNCNWCDKLVGQHLVKQLSELYDTLIVIARRPPRYINVSMRFYQVNDFDNLAEIFSSVGVDKKTDAFSCLGTTKKQAGSSEAFRKIDHDYNVNFAKLCQDRGVENFFYCLQ